MILVTLEVPGTMREHFDQEAYHLEFPDGATLGDLLVRIGQDHGERMGPSIWNRAENRFRGAVVIMIGTRAVKDRATPLQDGQTVKVFKAVVGG
jgi:molybdopterin converting factor small subunit